LTHLTSSTAQCVKALSCRKIKKSLDILIYGEHTVVVTALNCCKNIGIGIKRTLFKTCLYTPIKHENKKNMINISCIICKFCSLRSGDALLGPCSEENVIACKSTSFPQSNLGRARRYPSRQKMDSPALCATICAIPTADESSHSATGMLHLHSNATC